MDVAEADVNYAAVNVPFALGYTYEHTFSTGADLGWTFDPGDLRPRRSSRASASSGVKYLRSPIDPATGEAVGLTLFSTLSPRSGSLQDPNDDKQLYRYITGSLLPADGACSLPNPLADQDLLREHRQPGRHAVLPVVRPAQPGPGRFGTIVVAYIFAAPVAVGRLPRRRPAT